MIIMFDGEFSDKIILTKINTGESFELDQRRVKIRENHNGIMALSYVAPIFEIMDLEDFFDTLESYGKLTMDIGGTGEVNVNFRGLITGKGKKFSQNLDYRILLLEEYYPTKPGEYIDVKRVSTFMPRDKFFETFF